MAALKLLDIGRRQKNGASQHSSAHEDLRVAAQVVEPPDDILDGATEQNDPIILIKKNRWDLFKPAAPVNHFPLEVAGELDTWIAVRDQNRSASGAGHFVRRCAAIRELPGARRTENLADIQRLQVNSEPNLLQRKQIGPGRSRGEQRGASLVKFLQRPGVDPFIRFRILDELQQGRRVDFAERIVFPGQHIASLLFEDNFSIAPISGTIAFPRSERLGPMGGGLLGGGQELVFGVLQKMKKGSLICRSPI